MISFNFSAKIDSLMKTSNIIFLYIGTIKNIYKNIEKYKYNFTLQVILLISIILDWKCTYIYLKNIYIKLNKLFIF